jgi:hypothetical protein
MGFGQHGANYCNGILITNLYSLCVEKSNCKLFAIASLNYSWILKNPSKKLQKSPVLNMIHFLKSADDPDQKAAYGWHILTE